MSVDQLLLSEKKAFALLSPTEIEHLATHFGYIRSLAIKPNFIVMMKGTDELHIPKDTYFDDYPERIRDIVLELHRSQNIPISQLTGMFLGFKLIKLQRMVETLDARVSAFEKGTVEVPPQLTPSPAPLVEKSPAKSVKKISRRDVLTEFIALAFFPNQLRDFLNKHDYSHIASLVDFKRTGTKEEQAEAVARDVVDQLEKWSQIDHQFFNLLIEARPYWRAKIDPILALYKTKVSTIKT